MNSKETSELSESYMYAVGKAHRASIILPWNEVPM